MHRAHKPEQNHPGTCCQAIITEAETIFRQDSCAIMADPAFARLLARYREEIHATFRLMKELETGSDCSGCAARAPGGCCGAGIEEWYDPPLLLMNLFLGREIPRIRPHETCCMFLGENGCLLLSRHHICVNYLCDRITKRLPPHDLARLEAQAGRELFAGWQAERHLLGTLKTRSSRLTGT